MGGRQRSRCGGVHVVGDARIGFADARERGIDGLRVMRDGAVEGAHRALVRRSDGR